MDSDHGTLLREEPAEVRRLRARAEKITAMVAALAADRSASRLRRLVGLPALAEELRRIQPAARTSARVMQPQYSYDPEDPNIPLTRAARDRGVEVKVMTRPASVGTHPLLASIFPQTLVGPVFLRAMVIDGQEVIVGGPDDADGRRTAWHTAIPTVVQAVVDLWESTARLCRPILPPGTAPPITERQLEVARLLCVGEKDSSIARALGLSERTVEREVSALLRELGAGSRTQAVLLMRGRGVNGGWSSDVPSGP